MTLEKLIEILEPLRSISLPGKNAQLKMAAEERINQLNTIDLDQLHARKAGVMFLLYPKGKEVFFVLIERAFYRGVHSSQIALPGGKFELTDRDLQETAFRETEEEIGVLSSDIELVRAMTSLYIPPSNFVVFPFIGFSTKEIVFTPQEDEVASIIEIPVEELLDEQKVKYDTIITDYGEFNSNVFVFDGKLVWGATSMILNEIKELVKKALHTHSI